jgi:hypothetical protein
MPLIYTPSASLFDRAKAAFAKIQAKHVPDRQHGERDAIIAIVFSALALEAFINEVGDFAAYPNRENAEQDPQSVSIIGSMLGEIEESRGSMQQKFLMAKWIFSQQEYDRANQPYLDFAILVQVRNALAHVKSWVFTSTKVQCGVVGQLQNSILLPRLSNSLKPEDCWGMRHTGVGRSTGRRDWRL